MTLQLRPRQERGQFNHGWLETAHTFSFGHYFDPKWHQFRSLRVMNEDVVHPDQGFGMHGHQDMEILTWVLDGELEHRDSLGHGERLRPGEMQWMSAGSGIRHSEFNPSSELPVHLYQIWLLPDRAGHTPAYGQKAFDAEGRKNQWQTVASPDRRDGSLTIRQDATVAVAHLEPGASLKTQLPTNRSGWLQVLKGDVQLETQELTAGDGVAITDLPRFSLQSTQGADLMFFDLA